MSSHKFDTIEEAIADLKEGKMIVLVDDEDRENEGDVCCASERITPEAINFMAKHARGLICVSLTAEQTEQLNLPMMTENNASPFETGFTVSIEAAEGVTTGISAADRAKTILSAINPQASPRDVVVPGHVFPIKAKPGGVLQRAGQTEGSVDLAKLAGLVPSGVICEIMNDDGSMARYPELKEFSREHGLKMVTVKDLISYRLQNQKQIKEEYSSSVTTKYGKFNLRVFKNTLLPECYIALSCGEWSEDEVVLARVTKTNMFQCFFDLLKGDEAGHGKLLKMIQNAGKGILLFIIKQDELLPFSFFMEKKADSEATSSQALSRFRDYGFGAQVLRELGVKKISLITNNSRKLVGLEAYDIEVVDTVEF